MTLAESEWPVATEARATPCDVERRDRTRCSSAATVRIGHAGHRPRRILGLGRCFA
jgi:hypothetical protein